jgi:hypothetical protein
MGTVEKTCLLCEEKCWLKNVEYYCFFLKFQGRIDCNNAESAITVIEAPRQSDLLIELVRKLKPQVVVTSIAQFEAITCAAFSNILSATEDVGCRLFLDISENLEWSCLPSSNGVLKYLVGNTLPSHAAILWGLVKNQVPITYQRNLFFPFQNDCTYGMLSTILL